MVTQEDPNEFLEEVVKSCENVFSPHLRKCTERFVDIVNHPMTQQKMSEKFNIPIQNILKMIEECINATSLYDKLIRLKRIVSILTIANPLRIFKKLQNIGLSGVLSGDELEFLQSDELSLDGRVNKFLRYIEEDESQNRGNNKNKALDEYLESWKRNRQQWGWSQSKIKEADCKLRDEFESATIDNNTSLETCLFEISQACEPLRQKLVRVEKTVEKASTRVAVITTGAFFIHSALVLGPYALLVLPFLFKGTTILTKQTLKNNTIYGARSADKEWYNRTSQFIKDYLRDKFDDDCLKEFIERERLEPDLVHFNECVNPWLSDLKQKMENFTQKGFCLPKEVIMKETDRLFDFLYALILNKPEMLKKHQQVLDEIIQDAGRLRDVQSSSFLYPLISFGQLPLPSGERTRNVKFQFVLDNTLSEQGVDNVLNELEHIFSNITTKRITLHGNIPVIELDLHIEDNITTCVAQFIKKLADLKVRSILIGEFGFGGFRHAMNPAYNRIYSFCCIDKAEGFIPTYYTGPLIRGGEPYFCPNGWRRYSVDVGLTGREFEAQYGDWPVAYHGTEGHTAMSILLNGVRASGTGCFISKGEGAVYLSPSIEYSGHPRYARVWKVKSKYVQMVLQVRVSPNLIFDKKEGTLPGALKSNPPMDENFVDNESLEWVIKWPPDTQMKTANGILVYGLMLRVTKDHPGRLPHNKWWEGCRPNCWDFF